MKIHLEQHLSFLKSINHLLQNNNKVRRISFPSDLVCYCYHVRRPKETITLILFVSLFAVSLQWLSKAISRVMSWMVIYLGLLSPAASSNLPGSRRAALCFLFGLASDGVYICPARYQPGGSPLHCLSTLTALSVSGKTAVYFCCTVLGVASTRRYLASCPVKPGLSSPAPWKTDYSACPYRSSDHLPYSDRNYVITVLFFCPAYEPNSQFSV